MWRRWKTSSRFLRGCQGATSWRTERSPARWAGYRWRLDAQPFTAAFLVARAQSPWTPETIVLTVQGPSGAPMSFDMIRLVRTAGK